MGKPNESSDQRVAALERDFLARQAAMTEVLAILGDPASDLTSVLKAILESAVRLCDAELGTIYLQDGEVFRVAASAGPGGDLVEAYEREHPDRPGRHSMTGRVLMVGQAQQIPDVLADPEYDQPDAQRLMRFRTLLGLPILREGRIAGVFNLGRARGPTVRRR